MRYATSPIRHLTCSFSLNLRVVVYRKVDGEVVFLSAGCPGYDVRRNHASQRLAEKCVRYRKTPKRKQREGHLTAEQWYAHSAGKIRGAPVLF